MTKLTNKQQQNRSAILEVLYTKRPISRIKISHLTGITPATVSDITTDLMNEGIIYEIGRDTVESSGSGRKPILLDIAKRAAYFIGIELSEKFFTFCLSDNLGNVYNQSIFKAGKDFFHINADFLIDKLKIFIDENTAFTINSIGIALPGHLNINDYKIITNNTIWKDFNLQKFRDSFDIPIYTENNVNCMALSVLLFNIARRRENFIYYHIGRGMFCSYIHNGEIYSKNNFLIGEIGHTIINPEGQKCECGKNGCLQTYSSEAWILKKSKILYNNSSTTFLRQFASTADDIDIDTIINAYEIGDEGVLNIINTAIKYLAISLTNLSMILDTNVNYIHSELFKNNSLKQELIDNVNSHSSILPIDESTSTEILKYSDLDGAIGACSLAVKYNLINSI